MVMVKRPKSKATLPSHHSYARVVDVEPQQELDMRLAHSHDKRSGSSSRFLAWVLWRALAAVVVLIPVFLFIWNHLFAVDVGSVLVESRGGSSIEKTFTVR